MPKRVRLPVVVPTRAPGTDLHPTQQLPSRRRVRSRSRRRSSGLTRRLDETWPWVDDLANAFVKLRAAIP